MNRSIRSQTDIRRMNKTLVVPVLLVICALVSGVLMHPAPARAQGGPSVEETKIISASLVLAKAISYDERIELTDENTLVITVEYSFDATLLNSPQVEELLTTLGAKVPRTAEEVKAFFVGAQVTEATFDLIPPSPETQGRTLIVAAVVFSNFAKGTLIDNDLRSLAIAPVEGKKEAFALSFTPFKKSFASAEALAQYKGNTDVTNALAQTKAHITLEMPAYMDTASPGISPDHHALALEVPLFAPVDSRTVAFEFTKDSPYTGTILFAIIYIWIMGAICAFIIVALKRKPQ